MSVAASRWLPKALWSPQSVLFPSNPQGYLLWASLLAVSIHDVRLEYAIAAGLLLLGDWTSLASLATVGVLQIAAGLSANPAFTVRSSVVWLAASCARVSISLATVYVSAAVALLSLFARYTSAYRILWLIASPYPDIWGPFESRNNFAQWIELVLPIALFHSRPKRWSVWFAAAILLASGVASGSRAGILLITAELVFFMWSKRTPIKFTLALVIAIAAWSSLGRFRESMTSDVRPQIWRSTIQAIGDHPWVGSGLGSFEMVYPRYAYFDTGERVEHAHNDYLEWAAEGGLVYATLLLSAVSAIAWKARKHPWAWGLIAVALHALVDAPFHRFALLLWYSGIAIVLMRRSSVAGNYRM